MLFDNVIEGVECVLHHRLKRKTNGRSTRESRGKSRGNRGDDVSERQYCF